MNAINKLYTSPLRILKLLEVVLPLYGKAIVAAFSCWHFHCGWFILAKTDIFSSYHALCIIIIFCTLTHKSHWLPHTQYHTYFNGLFDGLSLSRIYCHPTFASMHVFDCIGRKRYMFRNSICLFVRHPTLHFWVCFVADMSERGRVL